MPKGAKKSSKTPDDFSRIKSDLKAALLAGLKSEVAMNEFEHDDGLGSVPAVDSKTVVRLSPIVKKFTGKEIDNTWIKQGGYNSIDEAINHLMENIKKTYDKS